MPNLMRTACHHRSVGAISSSICSFTGEWGPAAKRSGRYGHKTESCFQGSILGFQASTTSLAGLARNRLDLLRRCPRLGQNNLGRAIPARRCDRGRKRPLHHAFGNRARIAGGCGFSRLVNSRCIHIFELDAARKSTDEKQQQSLLYSSDLELGETTNRIFEAMERFSRRRRTR